MTEAAIHHGFGALRATEFPWTAETVYLNNASIGPIPERTRRALDAFNAKRTAPHHLADRDLLRILQDARQRIARLLNAEPAEVALAASTSYGLNQAARALPLEAGDVALVSDREFPANVYPWLRLGDRGVRAEVVPCTADGWPDEDRLIARLADPRVRLLAVSFVQFSNGFRVDLARISRACRENGAYLVVDGIQGVGQCPLDVRETPVDLLACGGQKWLLSPWGSGFLYIRKELLPTLEPAFVGWMAFQGTDDFCRLLAYDPTLRDDGCRFELNTLPYQDFYGMVHSLDLLLDLGVDRIGEHTVAVGETLLNWADERGMRVVSPRDPIHRSAIVCLAPAHPAEAYHALKRAGVVCSLREGALRFSPHAYNTREELERVIDVLEGEWWPQHGPP